MSTHPGLLTTPLIVGWLLFSGPLTASGQIVRVPGVTGTLALPESVDKFYSDVNKILVKTSDAVDHITRKSNDDDDRDSAASFDALQHGTEVVVQYVVKGIATSSPSTPNESIVTGVDRDKKRITVAFKDGGTKTFRLAKHGAFSEDDPRSRVVVYHRDAAGRTVAAYFKPVKSRP
jgi:hypothetical protein